MAMLVEYGTWASCQKDLRWGIPHDCIACKHNKVTNNSGLSWEEPEVVLYTAPVELLPLRFPTMKDGRTCRPQE